MDFIGNLIDKLKEQFSVGADIKEMLETVRLIEKGLSFNSHLDKNKIINNDTVSQLGLNFQSIDESPIVVEKKEDNFFVAKSLKNASERDVYLDIPTLIHQPIPCKKNVESKQLKQSSLSDCTSINDVIDNHTKDLAFSLQTDAINDLKNAISINDRYQYINQLFRGDETMYERSVKTINEFKGYSDAKLWIKRELAIKLSWKEEDDLVQQFYQLVSRRFSSI